MTPHIPCEACNKRGQTWRGDPPVCAFRNGSAWRSDNWNCATDGMLRRLVESNAAGVWHVRGDDQNVAAVSLVSAGLDGAVMLAMTWYKSRGRTEQVWLIDDDGAPRRPTEAEVLAVVAAFAP